MRRWSRITGEVSIFQLEQRGNAGVQGAEHISQGRNAYYIITDICILCRQPGGKQSWEESQHKWLKTFFFARLERVKPDQRQPVLTVRQDDLTHSNSVWFEATAESTTASLRLHKVNLCDITRSVRGTIIWTNQRHHRLKLLPKQHMGCGWVEWQMLTDRNIWIH